MLKTLVSHVAGTVHVTGSCLGQAIMHPKTKITHCSMKLDTPQSTAPWWGIASMTVIAGIGLAFGEVYHVESLKEVSRTFADGGIFLLVGRGQQVYSQSKKSR